MKGILMLRINKLIIVIFLVFAQSCLAAASTSQAQDNSPTQTFLHQKLATILSGVKHTPRNEAIAINYYIWRNFSHSSTASGMNPVNIFKVKDAQCQGRTILFAYFADILHLKNRIVSIFNFPQGTSGTHSVIEVYYNHKYHLFDPLSGSYFTETSSPNGHIINIKQLFTSKKDYTINQYHPCFDKKLILGGYKNSIPSAMPLIYNNSQKLYCKNNPVINIGLSSQGGIRNFSGYYIYQYSVKNSQFIYSKPLVIYDFKSTSLHNLSV